VANLIKIGLVGLLCFLSMPCNCSTNLSPEVIKIIKNKLNSEKIKYLFGNYGIEVLLKLDLNFKEYRVANLYSLQDGVKVSRTIAITKFSEPLPTVLHDVFKLIQEGNSIGSTLKQHGWQIIKKPFYFGEINLPRPICQYMQVSSTNKAAVQAYHLFASKPNLQRLKLCTIYEIYSPAYLTSSCLQKLYPYLYPIYLNNSLIPPQTIQQLKSLLASSQIAKIYPDLAVSSKPIVAIR